MEWIILCMSMRGHAYIYREMRTGIGTDVKVHEPPCLCKGCIIFSSVT